MKDNKMNAMIAIIDNGVDNSLIKGLERIEEIDFSHYGSAPRNSQYEPINHGTVCAAIIKKYAIDSKLISIKIMSQGDSRCLSLPLIKAIMYCIEMKIKFINISLGTNDPLIIVRLGNIIKEAITQNIIIIASGARDCIIYPACYQGVVYCDVNKRFLNMDNSCYKEECPNGHLAIIASGRQKILKKNGEEFITPNYSSFAAPVVTSVIWNKYIRNSSFDLEEFYSEISGKKTEV